MCTYGTRPFNVGPGTGLQFTHAWWAQKCLRPHWHSPKKRCPRCQMINITPLERLRAWEDNPRGSRSMSILPMRHDFWKPTSSSLDRLQTTKLKPHSPTWRGLAWKMFLGIGICWVPHFYMGPGTGSLLRYTWWAQ